jgi:hypothetical protein
MAIQGKKTCRWSIDKFKAGFVAQDFTQCPGFDLDETYADVVCFDFFWLLLAIIVVQCWRPQQVDLKSIFLYGNLEEEV